MYLESTDNKNVYSCLINNINKVQMPLNILETIRLSNRHRLALKAY